MALKALIYILTQLSVMHGTLRVKSRESEFTKF